VLGRSVRIVGGREADIRQFPHSVSFKLLRTGIHFCGGSIISNQHVLTAAHCLVKHQPTEFRIYMGNGEYKISGQDNFDMKSFVIYPTFSGQLKQNSVLHHDIAVITVL
jgi:trypsin